MTGGNDRRDMSGVGQSYEPERPGLVADGSGSLNDATDELCALLSGA